MITVLLVLGLFLSLDASAAQYQHGQNVNLTGRVSENLFASGKQITASFASTDDVFLAGGQISYSALTTENVYLAGGDINLTGASAREATIAGGTVKVSQAKFRELILAGGDVSVDQTALQDDLVLAGGKLTVGKDVNVRGAATIFGRDLAFEGTVAKDSMISGQNVRIAGRFDGNVRVYASKLVVDPGAVIAGNLVHTASDVNISPAATIRGATQAIPATSGSPWAGRGHGPGALAAFLFAAGVLLIPALVAFLFPNFVTGGRNDIRREFWADFGKGTLLAILTPAVLILLFMTVIGLPVGIASIPFLIVADIVAWSIAVFTVGDQLRLWTARDKTVARAATLTRGSRFGWTVLGALVLTVVLSIPVLGFIFCLVMFLAGVGAVYTNLVSQLRPNRFNAAPQT